MSLTVDILPGLQPIGKMLSTVADDWRAALARLDGAYSEHTLRSYRSDFARFEAWCDAAGQSSLPASPENVAAFVSHEAPAFSPATLKRRLASIRKVHRLLRLPNPATDEEVLLALRRAFRSKPRRQKQAHGLTADLRDRLIAACPESLLGLRNRAMIAVGYDTLCRRSELVGLRVDDLSRLDGGAGSILIRRAKNDPFGDGRLGYLSPRTVDSLDAWLHRAGIGSDWMFRSVHGKCVGLEPLHPFTVNRVIKAMAASAEIAPEAVRDLSGHSMRVGAAQDMMTRGLGILPIMKAGGWKSMSVVGRYVECAEFEQLLAGRFHQLPHS
jgi:integrase/recombinase XerD